MDGHLPKAVVQERFERLIALQEKISLEQNVASVGRDRGTAWSREPPRRTPLGLPAGRAGNKLVHFSNDGAEPGSLRTVTIVDAHPHHLDGELVAGRSEPARRSMTLPMATTGAGCASC